MKLMIDVENLRPNREYDLIVYDKIRNRWYSTSRERFLRPITSQLMVLNDRVEELQATYQKDLETLKKGVNERLEDYHNILQELTKGE